MRQALASACPSEDLLVGFFEHGMDGPQQRQLESHVDRCAPCRATVGHLAALALPAISRTVGRYRLDAELGRGGMGVVFRAWDPVLERELAVKLLHPELDDDLWRQRALREARALARLQHPNVIAIHDVGLADGEIFIATELIDGEPLDRWQKHKAPQQIVDAYAQAAHGLAAAHAIGLVHRDVKPSNILVSRAGRVCIGDFGLATSTHAALPARPHAGAPAAEHTPLPQLTMDGQVLGTPAYMPPEQQGGGPVDAAADQYALCLALAEALLGERPREGASAQELARPGVPAPWPAIARGLAVLPADRFPTLSELIAELERPLPAPAPRPRAPAQARPRRRRQLAMAALLTATLCAGWLLVRSGGANPPAGSGGPASNGGAPAKRSASPSAPPGEISWVASTAGPWRLPQPGRKVLIASATTALVTVALGHDQRQLMTVDLRTGATAAHRLVDGTARLHSVVRARDRILAFGEDRGCNAAWEISLTPLRAAALPLEPVCAPALPNTTAFNVEEEEVAGTEVIVSPSQARLVVCGAYGPPVVRDGRTLRALQTLPERSCWRMFFSDETHATISGSEVNLKTGSISIPDTERQAGPRGRTLYAERGGMDGEVTLGTKVLQREVFAHIPARWTPDGVAISLTAVSVGLRPGPRGQARQIPLAFDLATSYDVDAERAVLLDAAAVAVVDLTTGQVRLPEGNAGQLRSVAPYGGAVIAASNKVRAWRADGVQAEDPRRALQVATSSRSVPVAIIERYTGLSLWQPGRGRPREVSSSSTGESLVTMAAQDVWYEQDFGKVVRSHNGAASQPWISYDPKARARNLEAISPAGAVAISDYLALHVVDPTTGASRFWRRQPRCAVAKVALGPTLAAFVSRDHVGFIDLRSGIASAGLQLPPASSAEHLQRPGEATVAITPEQELLVAVQQDLWLWRPGEATMLRWSSKAPAGVHPVALRTSEDGSEVALGYATGAIAYATMRAIRAQGVKVPAPLASTGCLQPAETSLAPHQAMQMLRLTLPSEQPGATSQPGPLEQR